MRAGFRAAAAEGGSGQIGFGDLLTYSVIWYLAVGSGYPAFRCRELFLGVQAAAAGQAESRFPVSGRWQEYPNLDNRRQREISDHAAACEWRSRGGVVVFLLAL